METTVPKTSTVLAALIKADFTTLVRNRRSVVLVFLVPVIILVSWKPLVARYGGPFVLSSCITIGLMAIGLMGYSISVARDRDKGIFQRLRVAPLPAWTIMVSRLLIQLGMIIVLTLIVFIVGYQHDHITLSVTGYIFTLLTAFIGGAVYLSLGQVIVGLVKNPETVNAVTRLIYFVFIMVGMYGDLGSFGPEMKKWIHLNPYGAVKVLLAAGMEPGTWNHDTSVALLASVVYIVVFAVLGIQKFKWSSK